METPSRVRRDIPPNYTVPPFPSLFWPPQSGSIILYELDEMWKFTLFWTLILYGLFHLGAVGVAVLMQGGKRMSSWKYLWAVPVVYALIAGAEALIAGTLVAHSRTPDLARYLANNSQVDQSAWDWHNPALVPYLPHQPKSLVGIATRSFCLGIALATGVTATVAILTLTASPLWRLPFFLASLALFHFLEFWTTAAYNTRTAQVSSFLLTSNWPAYAIAHSAATLECLVTHLLWPGSSTSGGVGRWTVVLVGTGMVLVILGQAVRSAAMIQAGRSFNHLVQYQRRSGHVLVTTGVYAVLRHPSYFGFFWWALGTQMVMGNVLGFVGYAVVLWKFFSSRIRLEEEYLVGFFGREYIEYREKVPTRIPFLP
ncbi:protein-S-isoprenylcysteine O-methyltransferase [Corynascus novoguineensis]|uniref:Protein-S-isoprenylcysteine O-methyltransferase n=1 Tax=Corynascus novoguineensis TaxID=1126955 RepID=A0AAN7CWA3_9PEZI|nr:protein-S-isoprenylcysteine O-methyltransferase [Corynascus novoguineensis]